MLRFICMGLVLALAHNASAAALPPPVVGGSRVPAGKWRDVVVVVARDSICTGTLIAPDIVLTAGHCIESEPIEVITDSIDYGLPNGGGDRIKVKWSRAYPRWEDRYDVGVIMLEHVARGRARTVAAACSTRELLVPGAPVHVVGFGLATSRGDDDNTTLREADVPVIDPTCTTDSACQTSIAPHGEFVAGGSGTDSCFGDSGGPAYLETPDGPALVGVVSRGRARSGTPCGHGGVYVRADKVVSWIQGVTGTRIARTSCGGKTDDEADSGDGGGCSAGMGGGFGALGCLAAIARRRRARRATTEVS